MKVSKKWLKELVDYSVSEEELIQLLNHKTIGTKEVTQNYIELDMKGYNRADLLSLRGVAYEVAAIAKSKVLFTEIEDANYYWVEKGLKDLEVKVENEQDVPLYCLVKIEGLRVAPSSKEWKEKLADSGIRSINNIADVTNLIMLEYGQPLHAFDAETIFEEKIVVRKAKSNEKLVTLDNKERILSPDDIVIADPKKAVGLAGVMGGKNSEISDQTTTVLLEAAIFDPVTLRKTASRLGLNSEASKRFYHGLKAKRLFQALDAAIKMYQDLGGKVSGLSINGETQDLLRTIPLRLEKINQLIGVKLTDNQVEDYLKLLHFVFADKIIQENNISWVVTVPYFRLDIGIEEDLIEEVARIYGYEKIKPQAVSDENIAILDQSKFNFIRLIGEKMADLGFTEVSTYPYLSTKVIDCLGFAEKDKSSLVKIKNPISKETEYLRQNIWPNLLEVIDKNTRQGFKNLAIFEIGKVYKLDKNGSPSENYHLAVILANSSDNPMSELNAKLQILNKELNLNFEIKPQNPSEIVNYFAHPVRFTHVFKDNELIGRFFEIHKRVSDYYGLEKRITVFEIGLNLSTKQLAAKK